MTGRGNVYDVATKPARPSPDATPGFLHQHTHTSTHGVQLFRMHLHRRPEIEAKITSGLLATIESERNGETVNHTLLRTLLRMLSALQVPRAVAPLQRGHRA